MTADEVITLSRGALQRAAEFIRNGRELGYIRMPDADTPDSAHETPKIIAEAIAAIDALAPQAAPVGYADPKDVARVHQYPLCCLAPEPDGRCTMPLYAAPQAAPVAPEYARIEAARAVQAWIAQRATPAPKDA